MQAEKRYRMRVTFSKTGATRWIGHLDVARTWERALNRAKIPMVYSQGFNRRPRMQFANALPLGYTSQAELVDLWLREEMPADQLLQRLREKMAPGIEVKSVVAIIEKQKALPILIHEAWYSVELTFIKIGRSTLQKQIDTLLAQTQIQWEKAGRKNKGKFYDMRPLILSIEIIDGEPLGLRLHLKNIEGQTGRPAHVLSALGLDPLDCKIERTKLVMQGEG